jgi:hypothetical protein
MKTPGFAAATPPRANVQPLFTLPINPYKLLIYKHLQGRVPGVEELTCEKLFVRLALAKEECQ